jgi:hypothetical protein
MMMESIELAIVSLILCYYLLGQFNNKIPSFSFIIYNQFILFQFIQGNL